MRSNGSTEARDRPQRKRAKAVDVDALDPGGLRAFTARHPVVAFVGVAVTGFFLGRLLAHLWSSR
ncbi:MAG: hypothetical protein Q8O67_25205 [Deltaproteobacteria bacterium]|nr:hypothetical protein [Deltaproteobacteria bacterium]